MNLPTFFIIGAPKCGTTSLSEYLRAHPQVFFCSPKEPHFFAEDFPHHRCVTTISEYSELFRVVKPEQKAIGEGSALYLYSKDAIRNILQQIPAARFIVMLRNPVDLAYSMFRQALFDGWECLADFEEAWRRQTDRRIGRDIPKTCLDHRLLLYKEIASIGSQSERLLSFVPRAQVLPIFFEELVHDTQHVFANVCRFIGVEGRVHDIDFSPRNQSKRIRLPLFRAMLNRPPLVLSRLAAQCKTLVGHPKFEILGPLRRLNTAPWRQAALDADFHAELKTEFLDEVRKVESVWERTTGWP